MSYDNIQHLLDEARKEADFRYREGLFYGLTVGAGLMLIPVILLAVSR